MLLFIGNIFYTEDNQVNIRVTPTSSRRSEEVDNYIPPPLSIAGKLLVFKDVFFCVCDMLAPRVYCSDLNSLCIFWKPNLCRWYIVRFANFQFQKLYPKNQKKFKKQVKSTTNSILTKSIFFYSHFFRNNDF